MLLKLLLDYLPNDLLSQQNAYLTNLDKYDKTQKGYISIFLNEDITEENFAKSMFWKGRILKAAVRIASSCFRHWLFPKQDYMLYFDNLDDTSGKKIQKSWIISGQEYTSINA